MGEARSEETVAGTTRELRANRFTVVDDRGEVRATLGALGDGALGLRFADGDDRAQAELSVDDDGATNLKLHGRDGEVCAWMAVGRHGDPSLYLQGASRHHDGVRGHAKLSVDEHGCPVLSLHDRAGQPRVVLTLDERTGRGDLYLFDREGHSHDVPALRFDEGDPLPEPDPRVERLATRLARLERARARRWVAAAVLLLLGALGGVLGDQLASPRTTPAPPVEVITPATGRIVRAEEIALTDAHGTTRARLAVLPDGTPLLWMADPQNKTTAQLSLLAETGATLRLSGGKSSIVLTSPPHDLPSVGAYDGADILFQAPSNVARFLPPDGVP